MWIMLLVVKGNFLLICCMLNGSIEDIEIGDLCFNWLWGVGLWIGKVKWNK